MITFDVDLDNNRQTAMDITAEALLIGHVSVRRILRTYAVRLSLSSLIVRVSSVNRRTM